MVMQQDEAIRKVTKSLGDELLREALSAKSDITYHPVPFKDAEAATSPTWRIRLDLTFDSSARVGLDLNGELILGRQPEVAEFLELFGAYDGEQLGMSRQHALLGPTENKLYILDLGSTNGTWLNGHSIGVNMPYSLSNGDMIRLGRLEFSIQIVRRPEGAVVANHKVTAEEIFSKIARGITAQLRVSEVLKQTMDMAMRFTPSDTITIWLVDEQSGELYLEAGRGVNDEQIQRLAVSDSLVGRVIQTGHHLRFSGHKDEEHLRQKLDESVQAAIYCPLTLAGTAFGVLSAANHESGKLFSAEDERTMLFIADMAAVAIQNSRLHQATARAATRRAKVVSAINHAFAPTLKNLVNSTIGYAGMLYDDPRLFDEGVDIARMISENGSAIAHLIYHLNEIAAVIEDYSPQQSIIDLTDLVKRGLNDTVEAAEAKMSRLEYQVMGTPYLIYGDPNCIYKSVFNLVDNAIHYSPIMSKVSIILAFSHNEIIIRVRDTGPGIPEDYLPYLFERYFRSEESNGLGLGLEFVCAAVEAHRGTIVVQNLEEGGAEFMITLPGALRAT
jgi:signal transduction histidine kinase